MGVIGRINQILDLSKKIKASQDEICPLRLKNQLFIVMHECQSSSLLL